MLSRTPCSKKKFDGLEGKKGSIWVRSSGGEDQTKVGGACRKLIFNLGRVKRKKAASACAFHQQGEFDNTKLSFAERVAPRETHQTMKKFRKGGGVTETKARARKKLSKREGQKGRPFGLLNGWSCSRGEARAGPLAKT